MDESVQEHLIELDEASLNLLRAAQRIELRGHCKGSYWDGDKACALGAIIDTSTDHEAKITAAERLHHAVGGDVPIWNDAPERTPAEVVAKLRAVALGG
jgi:hypothetical protein